MEPREYQREECICRGLSWSCSRSPSPASRSGSPRAATTTTRATAAVAVDGGETTLDLTVGDIVPLTGDLAAFGPPGEKAADLAIDEINTALEEAGADHTVTIQHEDTQTKPHGAVSAARKLVERVRPASRARGRPRRRSRSAGRSRSARASCRSRRRRRARRSPPLEDDGLLNRTRAVGRAAGPGARGRDRRGARRSRRQTVTVAARNDAYGEGIADAFTDGLGGQGRRRSASRCSTTPSSRATTRRPSRSSRTIPTRT